MKLSRTIGYAVQAVLQLARVDPLTPVPCSELAAKGKMPERFLLQILRTLVAQGLLDSTRGVDGGYSLKKSPEEISLLDVVEAIDGRLEPGIPAIQGLAEETRIGLENAMKSVSRAARQRLKAVRLVELLPTGERERADRAVVSASAGN